MSRKEWMHGTCDKITSLADEPGLLTNRTLFLVQDGLTGTELVTFSYGWLLERG